EGGEWKSSLIFKDSGDVRKAVVADILPDHPGNELVACSRSGNITLAYGTKDGWTTEVIYSNPAHPLARLCVGDVDPNAPGLEIYAGADSFWIIGVKRSGNNWVSEEIFKDTDKNRGVWVGDVDPNIDGSELYAFGYSTRLVQITGGFGSSWTVKDIFRDVARSHEIRIGDVHPNAGVEIAIVGYSKNVTIVSQLEPAALSAPVVTGDDAMTIGSEEKKTLDLDVQYSSKMYFSMDDIEGLDITLKPSSMLYSGRITVEVQAGVITEDATDNVVLKIKHDGGTLSYPIELTLEKDDKAPEPREVRTMEGDVLQEGDKVLWNETLEISFNEVISESSFFAAKDGGMLKVIWGGSERDVVFTLSEDGKSVMIDLDEQAAAGDITIELSGLKDAAGNEIETFTLTLEVEGGDEGDDDNGMLFIIIIIAVLAVVAILGILIFLYQKKSGGEAEEKEDETFDTKEPKQI
ncbi:MAG: hypothetical protein ACMUIE_06580, partial [Thermoplasmatota archaeon]